MAEKNKKKKGRRAYLDDFQTTVSGEMIYCGAYYGFQGGDRARRRFLLKLAAASAVAAVFSVLSGCVPAPGTLNCFYVLLPLLGSILSAVSVLWAAIRLIGGGETLREYVYTATVEELMDRILQQNFVPVVDDRGCYIGIVKRRDIIGYFMDAAVFETDH